MTKRELNRYMSMPAMRVWKQESIRQAIVELTQERFNELLKAQQMAGYVA
jgi:hypothetical protein